MYNFKSILVLLLLCNTLVGQDIKLPDPNQDSKYPLMEALKERKSSREFSMKIIDEQTLANLLWTANGYNRDDAGKRTAPSSQNFQEIQIYVATESGLYLWSAEENILKMRIRKDLRAETGEQAFCTQAPINLIFVADMNFVKENNQRQLCSSYANTGFISQNIYLFCAANGLNTVVRGLVDREKLHTAADLEPEEVIIYAQTVGYPAL